MSRKKSVISAKNESISFWLEEKLHQLSLCKDKKYWIINITFSLIWINNYFVPIHKKLT